MRLTISKAIHNSTKTDTRSLILWKERNMIDKNEKGSG